MHRPSSDALPLTTGDLWGLRAAADRTACRNLIKTGSRSFYAASLLLPSPVRASACAVYAFCRLSDDAVDGADAEVDAVDRLRQRLDAIYAGRPLAIPADRAFADVIDRFEMPKALPSALLDGLAFDANGGRCDTKSDLFAYAAQVAAAVGAMMTVLMGVRDPTVLARACDLGVAMQLTNIARDIGEDARNGRLYLPREWLNEVGLHEAAFLANPVFDERIARLTARLVDEAEALYDRSLSGISGLPMACRPAIHAARILYREIGREVRRRGHNSVDSRAFIPDRQKLGLLTRAIAAAGVSTRLDPAPPLAEVAYLVEAVPPRRQRFQASANGAPTLDERVGWIIDLFGRMDERRERQFNGETMSLPGE